MTPARMQIEQISRANASYAYLGDHVGICRVLGKHLLYVDTRDKSLVPHLILGGCWEAWVTVAISQHMQAHPKRVAVDAGANLGYFSILMAEHASRLIAVEPNPRAREMCQRSLEVNGFREKSIVYKCALSDKDGGKAVLSCPSEHMGSGSIVGPVPPLNEGEVEGSFEVVTRTLDSLLEDEGIAEIGFVKIDCEGAEPLLWAGMRKTWRRSRGIAVCMEHAPVYSPADLLIERMRSDGARIQKVHPNGSLVPFERGDEHSFCMLWITHS